MLITIVAFLGILVVLILAHEIGHFITAKASKVKVEEFGLGFPPRLFGIKRGETTYSLNIVPLGGFVKMAGEENPNVPGSLASKGKPTRLLVLCSGSLMNLLLPLLLFSIAFMIPHNVAMEPVLVSKVAAGSPAETAGIQPGDTIISINGNPMNTLGLAYPITSHLDLINSANGKPINNVGELHKYVRLNLGNETEILIKHSDQTTETIKVVPRWKPPPGQGATGIELDIETARQNSTIVRKSYPFWEAIPMGVTDCIEAFVLFKNEILSWFIGAVSPQVMGPVGMAQITGEVARIGVSQLLGLAAFISINLGIVNILPLPALDGGRIIFVLVELARRGKRISPKVEGMIHLVGFMLLIAFMLAVTYQDILNIVGNK